VIVFLKSSAQEIRKKKTFNFKVSAIHKYFKCTSPPKRLYRKMIKRHLSPISIYDNIRNKKYLKTKSKQLQDRRNQMKVSIYVLSGISLFHFIEESIHKKRIGPENKGDPSRFEKRRGAWIPLGCNWFRLIDFLILFESF